MRAESPGTLARPSRPPAPPGAQPTLQESAPFYGDSSPANRRLRLRMAANQPQESAPFHGADSYRSSRKNPRRSSTYSSGSSLAAKWPPLGIIVKRTRL